MPTRKVWILAGQSNAAAYSPMGILRGSGLVSNPGSPGTAPDYVPGYQQTAGNEWTGSPPASVDSPNRVYDYPTASNAASLYNENSTSNYSGVVDAWGAYDKQVPKPTSQYLAFGGTPSGGTFTLTYSGQTTAAIAYSATYATLATNIKAGIETLSNVGADSIDVSNLSFAAGVGQVKITYYGATIGRSTTLLSVASNSLTGSSPTLTFTTVSLFGTYVDGGSYGLELSFAARFRAAYPATPLAIIKTALGGSSLAGDWLPANTGSNTTGTDKLQFAVMRLMIQQAAARLNASEPGAWEWGGFIWMQGESGAHSASTAASDATYLADARLFFTAVRALTRSNLPVLIGRIGDAWGWETTANPYLTIAGYPWAAVDASYDFSAFGTGAGDGRIAAPQVTRDGYRAGAVARRATQATLASDANCAGWGNDGYPPRPPYALTAAATDLTGYHWGGPGNLAAGERAFTAYQSAFGAAVYYPISFGGSKMILQTGAA
jgi:hypothetical protein